MPKEFFIEKPTQKEIKSKLEELEKYPDLRPRLTVAWPITKEKEQLLEMVNADAEELTKKENMEKIEKLRESEDFLDRDTGNYLSHKSTLTKDEKIGESDKKIKLLSTRKPLFATPNIAELLKKISTREQASKILHEKDEEFVGLVVFGSAQKGYYIPKSDFDFTLIRTKELKKIEDIKNLFCGIFLGDHKKLLKLQKQAFKKVNRKEWNEIRKDIMKRETENLSKTAKRFNINDRELEQIKANVAILRTPPPLREAREIINRRYEQEIKKEE